MAGTSRAFGQCSEHGGNGGFDRVTLSGVAAGDDGHVGFDQ